VSRHQVRLALTPTDPDKWHPRTATMVYLADDPYALHLHMDATTCWRFARDLLADGLTRHSGLGDVQCWPHPTARHPALLYLALSSPDGHMCWLLDAPQVAKFLRRIYGLVPRGCECEHIDLDADVDALLGRSTP